MSLDISSSTPGAEDVNVTGLTGRVRLQKHSGASISFNTSFQTLRNVEPTSQMDVHSYNTRSYKKNWMEIERTHLQAYEYLCHLSEAKQWVESCIDRDIGDLNDLAQSLQNGVFLAKLAKIFSPKIVKRIFEGEKLQFKHSDNINFFIEACKNIGLPQTFLFELTDLYAKKNIPKVIYCIHALSHLLHKKKLAPNIQDLVGYLDFTDDQLQLVKQELDINGYHFPAFLNVGSDLNKAMEGTASLRIKGKSVRHSNYKLKKESTIKFHTNRIQGSVRGKDIRLIPSHTATLTTSSAINMIKNGFTDVNFSPRFSLKGFEPSSSLPSRPSTVSGLNSSSTLGRDTTIEQRTKFDSLASSGTYNRAKISNVTYTKPKTQELSSPKISTASYRVVGKRSSTKFRRQMEESLSTPPHKKPTYESIEKARKSIFMNDSSSNTTSTGSYLGSVFHKFHEKKLDGLFLNSNLTVPESKPNTSSSILRKIQEDHINNLSVKLRSERFKERISSTSSCNLLALNSSEVVKAGSYFKQRSGNSLFQRSLMKFQEVSSNFSLQRSSSRQDNSSNYSSLNGYPIAKKNTGPNVKAKKSYNHFLTSRTNSSSNNPENRRYKHTGYSLNNKSKGHYLEISKSSLSNNSNIYHSLEKQKTNLNDRVNLKSESSLTIGISSASTELVHQNTSPLVNKFKISTGVKKLHPRANIFEVQQSSSSPSLDQLRKKFEQDALKSKDDKELPKNDGIVKRPTKQRIQTMPLVRTSTMTCIETQTTSNISKSTQTSPKPEIKKDGSGSISARFARFVNSFDNKLEKKNKERKGVDTAPFQPSDPAPRKMVVKNSSPNPESPPELEEDLRSDSSPNFSNDINIQSSREQEEEYEIADSPKTSDLDEDDQLGRAEGLGSSSDIMDNYDEPRFFKNVIQDSYTEKEVAKGTLHIDYSEKETSENSFMEENDCIQSDLDSSEEDIVFSDCYELDSEEYEEEYEEEYFEVEEDVEEIYELEDDTESSGEYTFEWENYEPFVVMAQSYVRGMQQRKIFKSMNQELYSFIHPIQKLQAIARGCLIRLYTMESIYQIRTIREAIDHNLVRNIQAVARKVLARHSFIPRLLEARAQTEGFFHHLYRFQALSRRVLVQRKWTDCLGTLHNRKFEVINIQAMVRGYLVRQYYRECSIEPIDPPLPQLTSSSHDSKQVGNIIKFQEEYWANRPQLTSYSPSQPEVEAPVTSMQSFINLLDDSDRDFGEELELEELRRQSIKKIRDISQAEMVLNELDIKIALLVRNRISLEEVLRLTRAGGLLGNGSSSINGKGSQDGDFKFGLSPNIVPLKKLDKENRRRLEGYQQLFYILQTQPKYLAKLLSLLNQSGQGQQNFQPTSAVQTAHPPTSLYVSESKRFFETVVLTLFGFAQNPREEFMLLNLFKTAIHLELDSITRIEDFLRGNPVFIKLAVHYNRGAKERKYLRELLQPIIHFILNDPDIDLQTNPLLIYRALIKQEESRTGERSLRPYDVTAEVALSDAETRTVLIRHLQQLRAITDQFIERIYSSLDSMPYGIRYIAKELKASLLKKFPTERENVIIKIVGHLVYYRYINPAIVAPESFDVIEMEISPHHRRCLAEVAKMLNQVSMGKLFTDDNIFLQPLNTYVAYTSDKFAKYIYAVTEIEEPETHFEIDEFLDQAKTKRPVIYISPNEIYSLHKMLGDNIDLIAADEEDPVSIILKEIGPPPSVSADQMLAHSKEISLHLVNRFPSINEFDCDLKHLFVETKRLITYVIRVQSGASLLDILQKPVGTIEESRFNEIIVKEFNARQEEASGSSLNQTQLSPSLTDITKMTFVEVKQLAFNNAIKLEAETLISRKDNYQKMLNSIAADIRTKSKRRILRKEELKRIYQTLNNLKQKEIYLKEQKTVYNDYLESCMNQHISKKSRKNKPIPFTKQYFHLKELEQNGGVPKFGSFKYTAERLYQKGVLISMNEYTPKQFDKIQITISSDQTGHFKVSSYYLDTKVPGAESNITLEFLLQSQFDNIQVISLFDGDVKVNVNLLVYLINKKFYS